MAHIIGSKVYVVKALHGHATLMMAWGVDRENGEKVKGWLSNPLTAPPSISFAYEGELNLGTQTLNDSTGVVLLVSENVMFIQVEEFQPPTIAPPPNLLGRL